MPRIARIVAPGLPHHITQRGNRRTDVFLDDDDRESYLGLVRHYGKKYGMEILAYCVMSNHIHLVVVPHESDSLARAMSTAHMCYAQRFNCKYSLSGHLWQGRFFSCVLDERHTMAAVRYVERNPVRAGLVRRAWDYRWSSARGHAGKTKDPLLSTSWPPDDLLAQWCDFLTSEEEGAGLADLRTCTRTGQPWGSAGFVERLENRFGQSLSPARRGRPPKNKQ